MLVDAQKTDDISMSKIPLSQNVLEAATARIEWTLATFSEVCVSLSGGKDSTVMLHLVALAARRLKMKINILFIDWEAQFQATIDHVISLKNEYADVTRHFWWVALPLKTVNAVSQLQPEWVCWDSRVEWVRQPPDFALCDPKTFPFYSEQMTFESFVQGFSRWYANHRPAAMLIGIRSDESVNRLRVITSNKKRRYADDKPWTAMSNNDGHCWNIYPLYDWKVADIWTWFARHPQQRCNPLYHLMYQAGVPLKYMRICEPFGPEQRQGLWLYHVLEPQNWARLCMRVQGANTGALHANESTPFYARRQLIKPDGMSWRQYALALLESMPPHTAEHYKNKVAVYLRWYMTRDYPDDIPDAQDNDTGSRDIPSWRRICKVFLTNDYWCRLLSFSPTRTNNYESYLKRMKRKREEWNILAK